MVEDREVQMAKFSEDVEQIKSELHKLMETRNIREKLFEGVQRSIEELQRLLVSDHQYELVQKHIEQLKLNDCNLKEDLEKDALSIKRETNNKFEELFKALESVDIVGWELALDEVSDFKNKLEAAEKLFTQSGSKLYKLKQSIRGNGCMNSLSFSTLKELLTTSNGKNPQVFD